MTGWNRRGAEILSRVAAAAFAIGAALAPVAATAQGAAVQVASGLESPVWVAAPAGDPRLFIVERAGRIRVLENGVVAPTPFLDLSDRVITPDFSEAGLLGLAFDPAYATNGFFYVFYVANADPGAGIVPLIRIARFTATDPAADVADPSSESVLFQLEHPNFNHIGGTVAIRDGFLYAGLGDGGGSGDPDDNGQDSSVWFGKLIRFDLSGSALPSPQLWAKGLRNPFRFAFDPATGDLYIGDVGQSTIEEVDVEPAASPGGLNYGWDVMEGSLCFDDSLYDGGPDPWEPPCNDPSLVLPVHEYTHDGGNCSITGGSVYRGSASPSLRGLYFFIDFCASRLTTLRWNPVTGLAEDVTDRHDEFLPDVGGELTQIVGIAPDGFGELHAVSLAGSVYRLVPEPDAALLGGAALATLAGVGRRRRAAR